MTGLRRTARARQASGLRRRLVRERQGVAIIEFALLMPLFVIIVIGIIELGQMLWTQTALQHAVEMAARCASINTTTCGTSATIQTYAVGQTYGMTLPNSTFTATTSTCGNTGKTGNLVTASYGFALKIPYVTSQTVTLLAQSCYPWK